MSSSPASTPPHHPNYGIQLSPISIKSLVQQVLPDATRIDVENLPSLKSYNNRIYYINCFTQDSDITAVLKVNGRGFGFAKIQNEVSCLRLLETFCPDIPAPRVIAWSQDGLTIETDRDAKWVKLQAEEENPGGWIFMTRVPGEPIDLSKLDDNDKQNLAVQLADYVRDWRVNVPPQTYGGNLCFEPDRSRSDITFPGPTGREAANLVIRGMLGDGLEHYEGIATLENYWKLRIQNKLKVLETDNTFASNRSLIASIKSFVDDVLPYINALKTGEDNFVFTHYDLSPRNVLISGSPPQITGIVDFEFSGFFPCLDEFLNDYIGNNDDWPKDMHEVYLKRLEENGVQTPLNGIEKEVWTQMSLLEELVQNISPWWLPGECKDDGLKQELDKAKSLVEEILAKFTS
ncbi:hypothetical protein F53441_11224 [Fusarium austroafricanum]|uniref:Aminoglycoside phosphotransferase domain-containing protein n=1 Tax=Fusarium austroafricanum TaxID=2364996 RepID=A0A8H4NTV7_9HYPO|nr:hypothetical protein F53441_11224 [Fusarium austroafricanum]